MKKRSANKRRTRGKRGKKKPAKKKIKQTASKQKPKKRKRILKEAGDILLFKYRPVNKYLIDALVKSHLHFCLPAQLNDPYDCQVDLKKALTRAASSAKGTQATKLRTLATGATLLKTIKDLLRKTAVCSFSSSLLNPVLWSHYADKHRGVALLYKIPQSFIINRATKIVGYSGIEYTEDSLTNWFVNNSVKFHVDYYVRIIKHMLTIKGPMWEYEGESRIMRAKAGQLNIDRSYLTQICFGLRTPKSDRDLIKKIVKSDYTTMDFCEIVVGGSDFGLEVKDL